SMQDVFLMTLLLRKHLKSGSHASSLKQKLEPLIRSWAGRFYQDFFLAGSTAKGTAVQSSADVDFFVSVSPQCSASLGDMYNSLFDFLKNAGLKPRKQNVSIGITI